MYNRRFWIDHVTEFVNKFRQTPNPDGTVTSEPVEGVVIQRGTPQNAANLNGMEEGILSNFILGMLLNQQLTQHKRILLDAAGETGQKTLTNSQAYPFNNSISTVALLKNRDNTNYTVECEVISSVGIVGDILISDKQVNGFKVRYNGSATSAVIKYTVRGGSYQ